MGLSDEIVKVLRTHGGMSPLGIALELHQEQMAYMVVEGEKKPVPTVGIKSVCDNSKKVENVGESLYSVKKEYR